MARDMDFSSRRRVVSRPGTITAQTTPTKTGRKSVVTNSQNQSLGKKSKALWWWLLIIIVVVVGSILIGYIYYQQQLQSSTTTALSALTTSPGQSTASRSNVSSTQNISIQVYDSGGGVEAVNSVITKLKGLGYATENVSNSQFNYNKTYIWYREGLVSEAEKIASVLNDRQVGLKETKVAGSFDVLVLVGEK